ncbi:hypothetical protein MKW94_025131 [Papaver nudicaule]|uniref:Uncharacterized protein n=1 Tax=Papaver nudicaule TaxID=74823 RepID=A0AA42AT90_PAPNU|nr:hypothetical protein [Papaver nudicaule]
MSWYTDPELFLSYWSSSFGYAITRVVIKYNVPLSNRDLAVVQKLDFSKHLFLGNNKESDYDALKASLAKDRTVSHNFVNCQGLELYSIIISLPTIPTPATILAEKQVVEKKISELVAEISSLKDSLNNVVTNLQEQLKQEKNDRQAQVSDLTKKLEERRGVEGGSADVQPWMRGDTVPSHWVPFEELDVLNLPKNIPATTMEEPSMPKFVEEYVTTNVQVNRFYRGTFIVAVNVGELTPENEKARFDPKFWGLYSNAGVSYAARKPLESEM